MHFRQLGMHMTYGAETLALEFLEGFQGFATTLCTIPSKEATNILFLWLGMARQGKHSGLEANVTAIVKFEN